MSGNLRKNVKLMEIKEIEGFFIIFSANHASEFANVFNNLSFYVALDSLIAQSMKYIWRYMHLRHTCNYEVVQSPSKWQMYSSTRINAVFTLTMKKIFPFYFRFQSICFSTSLQQCFKWMLTILLALFGTQFQFVRLDRTTYQNNF